MRTFTLVAGVLAVLLGGLWLLQGLGVVHMRPILCFANCAPVQGPSFTWAIAGGVVMLAGIAATYSARARRSPTP